LITAAAAVGAHVLCEKPLATAVSAYRAARAAVRRHRVVLHTVHNWKYSDAFGTVRRCLDTGAIGALRRIVFDTERDGCSAMVGENWRMRAATAGGGIMVDHGWHALYLVLALADAVPRRVRATMQRRRYAEIDVEDTAHCHIDFDGVSADINLTWAARARRTCWRFEGEAGELIVDDDRLIVRRGGTERSEPLTPALSAGSHHPEWFAGVIDAFARELDDPTVRGANQAEAEWCLLLLSQAYASHTGGGQAIDVPQLAAWLDDGAVAA
jgi:predicted dehydrogenase